MPPATRFSCFAFAKRQDFRLPAQTQASIESLLLSSAARVPHLHPAATNTRTTLPPVAPGRATHTLFPYVLAESLSRVGLHALELCGFGYEQGYWFRLATSPFELQLNSTAQFPCSLVRSYDSGMCRKPELCLFVHVALPWSGHSTPLSCGIESIPFALSHFRSVYTILLEKNDKYLPR
ncbi:hypothetical protein PMIN05_006129 [Paraphaeosphaeria minitans]